jgi:predicted Rossmann fold nucleotide-binding protein DprA/Smf involved in DNA uptake
MGNGNTHFLRQKGFSPHLPLFSPAPALSSAYNAAHKPPPDDEVFARLTLLLMPQVGNYTASQWVERYGTATEVLAMIRDRVLSLASWRLHDTAINQLLSQAYQQARTVIDHCVTNQIQLILSESPLFPRALGRLPSVPLVIFAKGDVQELRHEALRMCLFGKKKSTPFGIRAVQSTVQFLSEQGMGTMSSMGTECGVQAAYTAIRTHRKPIVLSPVSFDQLFRSNLRNVAQYIVDNGGLLLTDQIPGDATSSHYKMLTQVRLQLAASHGLMLTESDPQSGTSFAVLVSRQLQLPIFATHPMDMYAQANPDLVRLIRDDKTVITIVSRDELYKISQYYAEHMPSTAAAPTNPEPSMSRVLAWS